MILSFPKALACAVLLAAVSPVAWSTSPYPADPPAGRARQALPPLQTMADGTIEVEIPAELHDAMVAHRDEEGNVLIGDSVVVPAAPAQAASKRAGHE